MKRSYKITYWVLIALTVVFGICNLTIGHYKDTFYMFVQAAWLFLFMAQSKIVEQAQDLNEEWHVEYKDLVSKYNSLVNDYNNLICQHNDLENDHKKISGKYNEALKRETLLHKQVAELRKKPAAK